MGDAARAAGPVGKLVGTGPDVIDEGPEIGHREFARNAQHERVGSEIGDRREVLTWIVGNLAHLRDDHDLHGGRNEQGQSVGRGFRNRIGRDRAIRAGAVLDDKRLRERSREVIGGQVQMYFGNFSEIVPHRSGPNVIAIAVSSEKRHPALPDVPAIAETYPGFRTVTWNGLFGPAGMPKEIVDRLAQETMAMTRDPAMIERFAKLGVDPAGSTPRAFAELIEADFPIWKEAVQASGAKLE